MSNNETVNISRVELMRLIDKQEELINRLEFVADAIYVWNTDALDLNDNHKAGFTSIMDELIREFKSSTEFLK